MESKKINQLATNLAPVSTDLTVVGNPTTGELKKITLLQISSLFGGITSIGMVVPSGFSVSPSTLTANGTFTISGAGTTAQYIRGDGSLATFPTLLSSDKLIQEVRNNSGATMLKGTIVYIDGAVGNKATIAKALASSDATSAQTYGVVQDDIANNSNGYIVIVGEVTGLDTSAVTEGQQLYLSGTIAGYYTVTKPYAPIHLVYVAIVLRSHPTLGVLGVKIQNGYEMDELHNVNAQSPANNDGLFYNTTTSLWEKNTIAGVLGYTPVTSARTISTTAPLSGGGDLTANRTLSISQATTSVNGYLSSTDWNTFNGKQGTITLTTTGTSGAATLISNTLNIPQYSGTNIYNADGTLTGNRILTSGGYNLTFTGSNTAASAIARGLYLTPTLIASANSDVLVGLDVNPTFTLGAFTGVLSLGLRVTGDVTFNTGNIVGTSSKTWNNTFTTTQSDTIGISFVNNVSSTGLASTTIYNNINNINGTNTGASGNSTLAIRASYNYINARALTTTAGTSSIANQNNVYRADINDISTASGNTLIGVTSFLGHLQTLPSTAVTSTVYSYQTILQCYSGTMTQAFGWRNALNVNLLSSSQTSLITNYYGYYSQANIGTSTGGIGTVTNYYSIYISALTVGATGIVTNRWGIYAPDSVMTHSIVGNVLIGTATIAGYKLDVAGTSRLTGQTTLTGSVTASSALAQGIIATPTLVAAANNDVLVGLDINPTFTNGAFTGVANCAIRLGTFSAGSTPTPLNINMGGTFSSTGGQGLKLKLFDTNTNSSSLYGFTVSASNLDYVSGGGGHSFYNGGSATLIMRLSSSSGNLIIQNGGTFTDGGQRLQVTGTSYFSDSVQIGSNSIGTNTLRVGKNITGATTLNSVLVDGSVQSDVTADISYIVAQTRTAAATFNVTNSFLFRAAQASIGAGSTIGTQVGFYAEASLTGATNNYGFLGGIASGTNRWNLYMAGTANNYLSGVLTIGTTSPNASAKVQIDSTTQGFLPPRMTTTQKNAIATPAQGLMVFDTTLVKLCVYSGTAWETITSL